MKRLLPIVLILAAVSVRAQFTYKIEQNIPVEGDKVIPRIPWAGGLNAAQYNTMDLNEDGKQDLVLFDRMADKVVTFLNVNDQYVYAPEYEVFFPADITNWLLLRDYNCDGREDIFTGDLFGGKVYTNVTEPGQPLTWKPFLFYTGPGNTKSVSILTKGFSAQKINLQMQFDDLPAMLDADGDGDLDIFSISFAGNGSIEFHKNMAMERHNSCDSLDFERVTNRWGGVTECTCGDFAFENDPCDTGGRVKHAGGKSLLMLDVTNDGVLDVLLSEAACTELSLLENKGDLLSPVINSNEDFPLSTPVNLNYPAAYYEDVDFDGVKDLISTPNIFTKPFINTDLKRSNWFYKNTGSDSNPVFSFKGSSFLQDQMIDVGDNAVPAFVDYDSDGDYDLFISQFTSDVTAATIQLYENVGTTTEPAFKLVNDNFLNFTILALYNLKIQFADITRDGNIDLVFTATSFRTAVTALYYIPGKADFTFSLADVTPIVLPNYSLGSTENITVVDVNGDGEQDLLHGRSNGAVYYWRNQGNLSFLLNDLQYLGIGSSVLRQNLSFATGDFDSDGTLDLAIGDQTGELRIVSDFRRVDDAEAVEINEIVWNPISEEYTAYNLGGRIWPTAVNLYNAARPCLVVGNILGGITILHHSAEGQLPEEPSISLYPNPVAKNSPLMVSIDRAAQAEVFSITGQSVIPSAALSPQVLTEIKTYALAAGIYILRIKTSNKIISRRFVVK